MCGFPYLSDTTDTQLYYSVWVLLTFTITSLYFVIVASLDCFPSTGGFELEVGKDKCIFPFTYKGKTYHGQKCINTPRGSWCSTKVDANREHVTGNYGYCEGTPCETETGMLIIHKLGGIIIVRTEKGE